MITVFISGSRKISKINQEVLLRIKNILDKNGKILVGDSNGADKTVQKYLMEVGYKNVTVFCTGDICRNNLGNWETRNIFYKSKKKDFNFFTQKDKAMSKEADYGFMLWDGQSKGTINNAVNLLRDEKKALLFHSKSQKIISLSNMNDLRQLLINCNESTKEKLIVDLDIIELKDELAQKELSYA